MTTILVLPIAVEVGGGEMKLLFGLYPGGHFSADDGAWKVLVCLSKRVGYLRQSEGQLVRSRSFGWVGEARATWSALSNSWKPCLFCARARPELVIYRRKPSCVFYCQQPLVSRQLSLRSISRASDLSWGKPVYSLVDEFYVQWPECTERYPKAQYKGV